MSVVLVYFWFRASGISSFRVKKPSCLSTACIQWYFSTMRRTTMILYMFSLVFLA